MNQTEPKERGNEYTTFGWQAIRLTVPADWDMVVVSGDRRRGYLRMADSARVRFELRWESTGAGANPSLAASKYLKSVRKAARSQNAPCQVERHINLAAPPGKEVECYRWEADVQALAMVSLCRTCRRLVHMHVIGSPGEALKNKARTVFASLHDHPESSELLWRFFDVEFTSPEGMRLRSHGLKTGCIRMAFSGKAGELEFVRVSLADMILQKKGLKEWFESFYVGPLKHYLTKTQNKQVRGHDGLEVSGKARLLANPFGILGRRRAVRAVCWHCEDTNRLFICRFSSAAGGQDGIDRAVENFRCCG